MGERDRLEHEMYELRRIIQVDIEAVTDAIVSDADRDALMKQIEVRTDRCAELERQLAILVGREASGTP